MSNETWFEDETGVIVRLLEGERQADETPVRTSTGRSMAVSSRANREADVRAMLERRLELSAGLQNNRRSRIMKTIGYLFAVVVLAVLVVTAASDTAATQDKTRDSARDVSGRFSPYVDDVGQIRLPADYRRAWIHLGDWAVAKKEGQDPHELHEVYTQPGVLEAYQKTGEFPDGAVLVKEVRNTQTQKLNTGHVTWAADMKLWFVMVKDRTNRFPDNPIWGDGWGWALFLAKDPAKNTTTNYRISSIGCHIPVESTDWVFVQGYPELKKK